ncbi:putative ATP synthase, F0 complex, subunit G [Helianthus annuus]|nr:putative ATP synthase, F0 complex, subunit G [Helianthus annuus]
MASKLKQLQSKAGQASKFLSKHGSAYYKQLMEENKQYVQEPATVEKCNELSKQLFYTHLARLTLWIQYLTISYFYLIIHQYVLLSLLSLYPVKWKISCSVSRSGWVMGQTGWVIDPTTFFFSFV